MNCVDCKKEILYAKSAIYSGPTGRGKKKPRCVGCHEDAVSAAGRSAAKVNRYFPEPSEHDVDSNGDEAQWAFWYEHLSDRIFKQ